MKSELEGKDKALATLQEQVYLIYIISLRLILINKCFKA